MADFILRLGVEFNPRDVNSRRIREQIARAIGATTVSIERITISRNARDRLRNSFQSTAFRVERVGFSSQGRRNLQQSFGGFRFSIQRAIFGRSGRSELQQNFRRIPFTIGSVQIASAAIRQLQGQLSNVNVRTRGRAGGDALADRARQEFERRRQPPSIRGSDFEQINPQRVRALADEFRNLGTQTERLSGVGRQLRALGETQRSFGELAQRSDVTARSLGTTADRLRRVQAQAGQTRAALEQMQLQRRAQEAAALARENLRLVQSEDQATRATRQLTNVLRQSGVSAEVFGARLGQITARFAQYLISVRALLAVQQLFSASLDSIVRFDTVIQNLNQVLRQTPAELERTSQGLFEVAESVARSFEEVATATGIFVRAGFDIEESLRRAEAALIATNISELNAADATRLITSALQVFRDTLQDPIEFLDRLSFVADNAATSAGAVGQAFLRSASAARESGVGFEQLLGIIAATLEETQLQAGTVGTAIRTIFTRAVSNADQLREVANQFGANIRAGDDVITVFGRLAAIFQTLSVEQRNQIGLIVAGRRQFNIFSGIINNFAKSQELVEAQSNSTGVALEKNEETLQSLAGQGRQLVATFDQLINSLAGTTEGADGAGILRGIFSDVLVTANTLTQVVVDLIQRFNQAGAVVQTISGALRGAVGAGLLAVGGRLIAGLVNGFRQFLQVGGLIRGVLTELGGGVQRIQTQEQQINAQLERQLGLRQRIAQIAQRPVGQVVGQGVQAVRAGRLQQGGRNLLGRGLERLTGALNRTAEVFRNPTTTLAAARGRLSSFFQGDGDAAAAGRRRLAGIAALGAIANVAGTQLDRLSESLRASRTASDTFAAAGVDAGSQALQLGVTFGALTGSLRFGLLAGLVAAGGALIRFAREQEENANTALQFQEALASAGNFTVQQVRDGFGGDILRRAVEDIAGDLEDLDPDRLFNLDAVIARQGDLIEQSGEDLAAALDESKNAIDDFADTIQEFSAQTEFRREIAGAQRDARAGRIQADLEGQGLQGLDEITDPLSRALAISEDITGSLGRGASQAERLTVAFQAGRDLLESQSATLDDVIQDFGLQTEERARAQLRGEQINADLREQSAELQRARNEASDFARALQESQDAVSEIRREAEGAGDALTTGEGGGALSFQQQDLISSELERQNELTDQLRRQRETIENLDANIQRLRSQEVDITRVLRQEDEQIRDLLQDIQESFVEIIAASDESVSNAQRETAEILQRNQGLRRQAEIQAELLAVERNRGTLLERFEARQRATIAQANAEVDDQLQEQRANIEGLRNAARLLSGTDRDSAANLTRAADELERAVNAQQAALQEEVELRLRPTLEAQAFEELTRTEEQLRQIRLEGINQAIDAEQRRTERQNQALQTLDDFIRGLEGGDAGARAAGGRATGAASIRALRRTIEDELRGISDEARDVFGDVGALLVRNTLAGFEQVAQRGREILEQITQIDDPTQRQRQAAQIEQQIVERNEEAIQLIRERVLGELQRSADRATDAEEVLTEARDRLSDATSRVSQAEDSVAQASERVEQAQSALADATQAAADAQLAYNVQLVQARISVLNSTGAFRTFSEQVAALNDITAEAARVVNASEESILQTRARIAQEALTIFQNQFNAIQSLGTRAATATLDEFTDLQTGLAAAQQVLAGQGGDLPPELLQLASQFTDLFPGLERAISEIGLERLGVDPSVLEDIQSRQLELAEITADSAQTGVVQAEQQIAAAFAQLAEAREQKNIAQEQLSAAREIEERAKENAEAAFRTAGAAERGFTTQANLARSTLSQISGQFVLGQRSLEVLNESRSLQRDAVNELVELNNRLGSFTFSATDVSNNARGSLSQGEINGLLQAAQREKRGMPPGSRLMLANTSEVVLTRGQARSIGLRPVPKANAQEGNAAGGGSLQSMAAALNAAVNTLISRLDSAALVQQNIAVQVDSNRRVDVTGLDQIDNALRDVLQERFGTFATREEQQAIQEIVIGLLTRLNEAQIVNSRGF